MYATCLFCNAHLGRNEAIEHFPVGRRLAYDAAKGRLWVVCGKCERWNLTPLETRWEAIDEAERLFRATKLRRISDNIGLAEVREGLQLVRVGAPPPLEFAAWRYGDQFGRRRRRSLAIAIPLGVGVTALAAAPLIGMATGATILSVPQFVYHGFFWWQRHRHQRKFVATVRDHDGIDRRLSMQNVGCVELPPLAGREDWDLFVPYGGAGAHKVNRAVKLRGPEAMRALATILPLVNGAGGNRRTVSEAVGAIDEAHDVRALLATACKHRTPFRSSFEVPAYTSNVSILPGRFRLALEMSLHAEDERRAMDGELAELEARWRAAEEIAAIADSLLIAPEVDDKLSAMHTSGAGGVDSPQ